MSSETRHIDPDTGENLAPMTTGEFLDHIENDLPAAAPTDSDEPNDPFVMMRNGLVEYLTGLKTVVNLLDSVKDKLPPSAIKDYDDIMLPLLDGCDKLTDNSEKLGNFMEVLTIMFEQTTNSSVSDS